MLYALRVGVCRYAGPTRYDHLPLILAVPPPPSLKPLSHYSRGAPFFASGNPPRIFFLQWWASARWPTFGTRPSCGLAGSIFGSICCDPRLHILGRRTSKRDTYEVLSLSS